MARHYLGPRQSALRAGKERKNRVCAYWWLDEINFGDQLTPEILRSYGYEAIHRPARLAPLVICGSLLEHIPATYDGMILGAGFLDSKTDRQFPRARVLAVRGHRTREKLGLPNDTPVGDPGLLSHRLQPAAMDTSYELGIVPHYRESDSPVPRRLKERSGDAVCVIDVRRKPAEVLRDMSRCANIIASSLHGLVAADSMGIPSAWMMPARGCNRSRFKYDDYYSALGLEQDPVLLSGEEPLTDLLRLPTLKQSPAKRVAENLHRLIKDLPAHIQPW